MLREICRNFTISKNKFLHCLSPGTVYYVSGLQEHFPTSRVKSDGVYIEEVVPVVSFHDCSQIITKYVLSKAKPPEELPLKNIFAFSYYFDRATDVGLIGMLIKTNSSPIIIYCAADLPVISCKSFIQGGNFMVNR